MGGLTLFQEWMRMGLGKAEGTGGGEGVGTGIERRIRKDSFLKNN